MRHANVEEHEVGARLADEREHLRPGLGLADDLESAVGFERPLDPVEDEAMVVGDHDAHGASVAQAPDAGLAPKRRGPPETEIGAPRRTPSAVTVE